LWDAASESFARGASGDVHVFINLPRAWEGSIWAQTELPALVDNRAVPDKCSIFWEDEMTESFSEPEPNVIESSQGFSVRVLGRTGMRYTEGCRSVEIDSEVGGASTGMHYRINNLHKKGKWFENKDHPFEPADYWFHGSMSGDERTHPKKGDTVYFRDSITWLAVTDIYHTIHFGDSVVLG
jgi:hypothetical protein